MSDRLMLRDHSQPCEHYIEENHYGSKAIKVLGFPGKPEHWHCKDLLCPGGREVVFVPWNLWCWAHDCEPLGDRDACLLENYGKCDVRPMYELEVTNDE